MGRDPCRTPPMPHRQENNPSVYPPMTRMHDDTGKRKEKNERKEKKESETERREQKSSDGKMNGRHSSFERQKTVSR